jgi:hypothetical protein
MITELRNFGRAHRLAFAGFGTQPHIGPSRQFALASTPVELPRRPDASIISEAIPLFYIGRNSKGLWVARKAEGNIGGIFLTRRAAVRFARESCEPLGCATMFVSGPLELDLDMRGAAPMTQNASALATAANHASVFAVIRVGAAAVRKVYASITHALAAERRNRKAIEKELFGCRYTLASKNDDDLPPAL